MQPVGEDQQRTVKSFKLTLLRLGPVLPLGGGGRDCVDNMIKV